jgi:hypothetical protein
MSRQPHLIIYGPGGGPGGGGAGGGAAPLLVPPELVPPDEVPPELVPPDELAPPPPSPEVTIAVLIRMNMLRIFVPTIPVMLMVANAISAAIKAYSISVCPHLLRRVFLSMASFILCREQISGVRAQSTTNHQSQRSGDPDPSGPPTLIPRPSPSPSSCCFPRWFLPRSAALLL